jgi:XTP/dITP diphosphohydrolase
VTPASDRLSPPTRVLIATRSPGKTREVRDLFSGLPFELVFPDSAGLPRVPEEDGIERGSTYLENAVAKARYFVARAGIPSIADDSGLEVDALGGAPGPRSARFALEERPGAPPADVDAANNALLLERLEGVPAERRTARYRCVVAYVEGLGVQPQIVEATCEGRILTAPRGTDGFGYDPLFYSDELHMTFAEAPAAAKHRVSHRGRAFRALIEVLVRRRQ